MAYQSELVEYCQHEQLLTGIDIASGFSCLLIEQIVQNLQHIDTIEYLRDHFDFFSEEHVIETWQFINTIVLSNGNEGESRLTKEKSPLYTDKSTDEESSSSQHSAIRKQNTILLYDDDGWSS